MYKEILEFVGIYFFKLFLKSLLHPVTLPSETGHFDRTYRLGKNV